MDNRKSGGARTHPPPERPGTRDRNYIFSELRERIRGFATSRIGSDRAEDVAQETLLVLMDKYDSVANLTELLRIAFKVARFKIGNLIRLEQRRRTEGLEAKQWDGLPAPTLGGPEDQAVRSQMSDQLAGSVALMSGRCREIFRMKLQGHGFEVIAERLGAASVNTVYVWDHRCRKKLRGILRRRFQWDI